MQNVVPVGLFEVACAKSVAVSMLTPVHELTAAVQALVLALTLACEERFPAPS
jgi:hypothetical protein